jgi:hypothetical protein
MREINNNREIVLNANNRLFTSAKSGKIIVSDENYNDFRLFTDDEDKPEKSNSEKVALAGKIFAIGLLFYLVFQISKK